MEKLKFVTVVGSVLALVAGGFSVFTTSDAEIQTYIEDALRKGCRPVVDICSGDCKQVDLVAQGITPACVPKQVLRADPQRVLSQYITLAKHYGADEAEVQKWADTIREKMQGTVEPKKEELGIEEKKPFVIDF